MADQEWMPLRQAVVEVSQAYANAMDCTRREAVDIAVTAILRRLEFMACSARATRWILNFKETDDSPESRSDQSDGEIPSTFWALLAGADLPHAADWVSGEYSFSTDEGEHNPFVFGMALGVEVTREGLPVIGEESGTALKGAQMAPPQKERGRPLKWDWEGALCAIIADANGLDGLPDGHGAQAEVGRRIAQWFRDNQGGEPASSEIGKRSAKVMAAIENDRK